MLWLWLFWTGNAKYDNEGVWSFWDCRAGDLAVGESWISCGSILKNNQLMHFQPVGRFEFKMPFHNGCFSQRHPGSWKDSELSLQFQLYKLLKLILHGLNLHLTCNVNLTCNVKKLKSSVKSPSSCIYHAMKTVLPIVLPGRLITNSIIKQAFQNWWNANNANPLNPFVQRAIR